MLFPAFLPDGARAWDPLQKAPRQAERAGELLSKGHSEEAVDAYAHAQALDPLRSEYRLGLGEALYATGDLEGAMNQFLAAAADSQRAQFRQRALYNAGNVALAAKDPEKALSFYQQALLAADPDEDLLQNLELAQALLEAQQKQQQQQKKGKNQDQKKKDQDQDQKDQSAQQKQDQQQQDQQKQDQQQRDQQQQDQQRQDQQKQDQQQKDQQQSQEPPKPPESSSAADSTRQQTASTDSTSQALADSMANPPPGMTRAEALRLLNALDHDEEELRRSIQRRLRGKGTKSTHEW